MPFALIGIALILLVSGVKGTQKDLGNLIVGDFTGQGNFIYWVVSVMAIGGLGYIPKLKPVSDAFLVLILLVLFISNKGFFAKFNEQLGSATVTPPTSSGGGTPLFTPPTLDTIFPSASQANANANTFNPIQLYGSLP